MSSAGFVIGTTTWSDVTLAIGVAIVGGVIGIVGTLAATRAQASLATSERNATQQQARIERVAAVLGPIRTLIIDANPERMVFQGGKLLEGYWKRWLPLRDQLEVVAVTEPSAAVRDQMRRLEVEMVNLFGRLAILFSPKLQTQAAEAGSERNYYDDARGHHLEADKIAEALLRELHGEGNAGATRPPETAQDEPTVDTAKTED